MTGERERQLRELEERLGHRFADLSLLDRALTHASRAHEDGPSVNTPKKSFWPKRAPSSELPTSTPPTASVRPSNTGLHA